MKTKNRILTATNYTYMEPVNSVRARKKAAEWGSSSNYINYLVAKDHGDEASMKRSREQQEIFFTPHLARAPEERAQEKAKLSRKNKAKRKVKKVKAGKFLRAKSKKPSKKFSRSKKKSVKRASSSRPKKVARAQVSSASREAVA